MINIYLLLGTGLVFLLACGSGGRGVRVGLLEDFEARLEPLRKEGPTWMTSGRAWRERRRNGDEELRVRCSAIRTNTGTPRIPAGAEMEVRLDGEVLGTAGLRGRTTA